MINVGRQGTWKGRWGNPVQCTRASRDAAVDQYMTFLLKNVGLRADVLQLSGSILVCPMCSEQDNCHASIIQACHDGAVKIHRQFAPILKDELRLPAPGRVTDGGGIKSTADWCAPPEGSTDCFLLTRNGFLKLCSRESLPQKLLGHRPGSPAPIFSPAIGQAAKAIMTATLIPTCEGYEPVPDHPDSPVRFSTLHRAGTISGDPDTRGIEAMSAGVSTGRPAPLPPLGPLN